MNLKPLLLAMTLSLTLAGCMVGPDYQKPAMPLSMGFKEGTQWPEAADAALLGDGLMRCTRAAMREAVTGRSSLMALTGATVRGSGEGAIRRDRSGLIGSAYGWRRTERVRSGGRALWGCFSWGIGGSHSKALWLRGAMAWLLQNRWVYRCLVDRYRRQASSHT